MRYFNTLGPVNETEHYVVSRSDLVAGLATQIERGIYFTIHAPRQTGKTTLMRYLAEVLRQKPDYLPVMLSFEDFESLAVTDFINAFWSEFGPAILEALQTRSLLKLSIQKLLTEHSPSDFVSLRKLLEALHQELPKLNIVLIIDEFDATPQQAISPLLQTWRKIYLAGGPPRPLHSVVLIGLRNIATLNLGRSSPFNIARQIQLSSFTLSEVQALLAQYTTERGQRFTPGVIEEVHAQTGGQPFLVNRLAAILTEEIASEENPALPFSKGETDLSPLSQKETKKFPINHADLRRALFLLARERNYNYETLVRHAKSAQEPVLRILFGARLKFTLNTPWVHTLNMYGIIKENAQGFCDIACPLYKRILSDYFQPLESDLLAAILVNGYDLRLHVVGDELQLEQLLSHFREFVERRGREAFKVTPMPQEATGQYLLMAYLDLLVRQVGGDLFTEVCSGTGRLDLITVYRGHRYIIETKIWYGAAEFDKGLDQLEGYLESEGQTVGYYVVFHTRPGVYGKLTLEQLEWVEQRERSKIYVYLVRLGSVFEAQTLHTKRKKPKMTNDQ
ncbi:MAG: hypothetical protein GY862_33740 [Gammaproteobacteria bacterium]|nr:hypothetical protein [Gammaproteobacteria bacterium]